MEVGAVKQAFNNEVIQLKKNLNQAKIQVIHKLTRKAKTLTEKKAPEHLQAKNKKKAESAVKEVLIIKKLKPRDIAKFIITNKTELNSHLNKPVVDNDKACARLLLHKALQQKYKMMKDKFGDIPIKDLLMSRQERLKLKKEAKEAQKKKKKGKEGNIVNSEGDWSVENVAIGDKSKDIDSDDDNEDEGTDDENNDPAGNDVSNDGDQDISDEDMPVTRQVVNGSDESSDEEILENEDDGSEDNDNEPSDDEGNKSSENESNEGSSDDKNDGSGDQDNEHNEDSEDNDEDMISESESSGHKVHNKHEIKLKKVKPAEVQTIMKLPKSETKNLDLEEVLSTLKPKKKLDKKVKENKNKNLNEKMLKRKFKKDSSDTHTEQKVVDPFFKTATGENYMSVAEPRQPDEFKEVHRQGNRQERRAAMFGRAPIRPRNNKPDFRSGNFDRNASNNNFNKFDNRKEKSNDRNGFSNKNSQFNERNLKFNDSNSKFNNRNSNINDKNTKFNGRNDRGSNFNDRNSNFSDRKSGNDRNPNFNDHNSNKSQPKEEKLHPSWEAKKKQSGIQPFKGKKIVFDES